MNKERGIPEKRTFSNHWSLGKEPEREKRGGVPVQKIERMPSFDEDQMEKFFSLNASDLRKLVRSIPYNGEMITSENGDIFYTGKAVEFIRAVRLERLGNYDPNKPITNAKLRLSLQSCIGVMFDGQGLVVGDLYTVARIQAESLLDKKR